jgi:uncharacterized protein
MFGLVISFGAMVGFALGLTGGGGGIFAVPLLVYGLATPPREAVGISLASVGGTALFGAVPRLMRNEVELRTGMMFAVAGMLGAPIGSYIAVYVDETVLLMMFGGLMLLVAERMWAKTQPTGCGPVAPGSSTVKPGAAESDGGACRRDEQGRLHMTTRCSVLLLCVGALTGLLSGLFGVGGGFVIVPALVLFSGMSMHKAVGTSLFVIVLISLSGVGSHAIAGNAIDGGVTLLFLTGGILGMWLGGKAASRLEGPTLQKVFAVAIVLVAAFVIFQSIVQ